jgi:hypothetical protein
MDLSNNNLDIENIESNKKELKTNDFVDDVTLKFLMNKNHYHRYLSHSDPKKHAELEEYFSNIIKYKMDIMWITNDLIDNPKKQINTEINDIFEAFMKSLIKYFKYKEIENTGSDEEDMLFGYSMNNNNNNYVDDDLAPVTSPMGSFWGKERIKKTNKSNIYNMNYIPRKNSFS